MANNSQIKNLKTIRSVKELTLRVLPLIILFVNLLNHTFLPNKQATSISDSYEGVLIAGIIIYSTIFFVSLSSNKLWSKLRNQAILLTAAFLVLTVCDLATLKFALLRLPYFPVPDKVLSVFATDWQLLLNCAANSLVLLLTGFLLGTNRWQLSRG